MIWYWKFDAKKQYYHQFRTIDYATAVRFYKANRFTMWETDKSTMWSFNDMLKFMKEEEEGDTEDNQEDGEGEGGFS